MYVLISWHFWWNLWLGEVLFVHFLCKVLRETRSALRIIIILCFLELNLEIVKLNEIFLNRRTWKKIILKHKGLDSKNRARKVKKKKKKNENNSILHLVKQLYFKMNWSDYLEFQRNLPGLFSKVVKFGFFANLRS